MRAISIWILLLAGCTPVAWVKSDASAAQVAADEQACRQAAAREVSFHAYQYHHRLQPVVVGPGQVIFPCGGAVDAEQALHENRLVQSCMESKGYEVTIQPSPGGASAGKP